MREVESTQLELGSTNIGVVHINPKSRDDVPVPMRSLQHLYETVKLLLSCKKNLGKSDRDGEFETAGLPSFARWIENCWKMDRN